MVGALLLGLGIGCPAAPNDAQQKQPATDNRAAWTLRPGVQTVAHHRDGGRLFVYQGPPNLDSGLPGIVEDEGRGPAYGLLGGYFAPRILATASS
ncbi:MAG: hypothetical protein AAF449_19770, partial [Myxococcota bacterium]